MTPHKKLKKLDAEGTPYALESHDTYTSTGVRMKMIQREVFNHSKEWVETRVVAMQSRDSRDATIRVIEGEPRIWMRWKKMPSFEIVEM